MGSTILLLAAFISVITDGGAVTCDTDWHEFNNNCYFFGGIWDWYSSKIRCDQMGYGMVVINDQATNDFVATLPSKSGHRHSTIWIGLNDRFKESQFHWEDGRELTYVNWSDGEPNNITNEDCVEMVVSSGKWNDVSCDEDRHYICQKYAGPVTIPIPPDTAAPTAAPRPTAPPVNTFQCRDGRAIPKQWTCDRIVDCLGADDELNCGL